MDLLDRLLEHDRWATNVLFDTCAPLDETQWHESFDIGHQNLHATFGHLIGSIEYWLDTMKQLEVDRSSEDWAISNLRPRYDRDFEEFETFVRGIRDQDRFEDTFVDPWGSQMTYGGAILHVILHDEDHRTEMLHMLNRLGVESVPEIDHGLWDYVRRGLASD